MSEDYMPTILIRESDSPEGPWTEIAVTPIEHIRELVTFTDRNPELAEAAKAGDAQARRLLARLSKTTERIRDELEQFGPAPQAVHHFVALEPELMRRIAALKKALAAWTQPKPLKADSYPIQTGQEVDALSRAASDGRTNRNWKRDDQCSALVHYAPGHSHYVQVPLMPEEVSDGAAIDALERLVRDMDADCVFAILYVWRLLLPPIPLPPNQYASVWIDLDDVASRVWPRRPKNAQERRERRKRVYDYLLFVARTRVVGRRSGVYRDKDTGKELSTSVGTPLWAIGRLEWLDGAFALDPISPESLPVRMELVCTDEWKRLAANPNTCQYLPYGELLGGIPGDRVTGAWARVIGLALANHWRRNPRETLAGMRWPTRRELLQRFTPKLAPSHEVMEGPHPMRAITYWHGALQELCNRGFLAREGEAARKIAEMKNVGSRYGWQDKWLDEHVDLRPGPKERPHLEQLASAMPMLRPRELSPAKRPRTARKKP